MTTSPWTEKKPTAVLVFADGTVVRGHGVGATGEARAEVCFNTALTGYQEILTDPSYLGQIVTFTFPHIGNIGANDEDIEDLTPAAHIGAVGAILKADITEPSNYRSAGHFDAWLKARGIVGLSGIDTRALTAWIRENGAPNAVIAHDPSGDFDIEALKQRPPRGAGSRALISPRTPRPASPRAGPRPPGCGAKALAKPVSRWPTSSPSTTASSATSCGCFPASAARSRWCRPP
jgi:carbamoyl-phosphate synthase small subunit